MIVVVNPVEVTKISIVVVVVVLVVVLLHIMTHVLMSRACWRHYDQSSQ